MKSNAVTIALLALLAGCASSPTSYQTTKVAVPVQCRETVPDRPVMPTESLPADPTLDAFVQASTAEIERREGYEGELRTALQACTAAPGPLEGGRRGQ
jgi:hypothetical protein